MTKYREVAKVYAEKACDTVPRKNDGYPLTRTLGELKDDAIQDFLAGCEHVEKQQEEFIEKVIAYMDLMNRVTCFHDFTSDHQYRLYNELTREMHEYLRKRLPSPPSLK